MVGFNEPHQLVPLRQACGELDVSMSSLQALLVKHGLGTVEKSPRKIFVTVENLVKLVDCCKKSAADYSVVKDYEKRREASKLNNRARAAERKAARSK